MIANHLPPPPPAPPSGAPAGEPSRSLSAAGYAFLQKYIHDQSGIVIEGDKQYLLEARLQPLLREHKIASLEALSRRLADGGGAPSLGRLVIEAMTTHETLFFRDPAMYAALREQVLPALFKQAGQRRLRIWSAAASSGQEAYSAAMLLLEMGYPGARFEILGTDIAAQVLDRARAGRYVQFEVNRGLPPAYLTKYFNPVGAAWQLKDEVRSLVHFQQLDLRRDFRSLGSFDLIFCRNVLIYFDTETKKKIVSSLRASMAPGGMLVLGCAETVINIHDGFSRSSIGQAAFYSV